MRLTQLSSGVVWAPFVLTEWTQTSAIERTRFGYLAELAMLQQFNSRLDRHAVSTTPTACWLVGIQPGLEYTFARHESGAKVVGATGVMFTVGGQDDIRAVYPNISLKYFFERH